MKHCRFFLIVLLSGLGLAQDSPEFKACGDKAMTQAQMNACAIDEAKRLDDELNRSYKLLLTNVHDNALATAKIQAAERAWVAYRDAYIEAMYPARDKATEYGTIYPLELNLLKAKLTRQQIDHLHELQKQHKAQ
jgi:uncharacterized protein YecT (DUF1311 family)